MSFVRCNACPVHGQCDEYGSCLNTIVIMETQQHTRTGTPAHIVVVPVQPITTSDPEGFSTPKAGTSTDRIFRCCAEMWQKVGFPEDKNSLDSIRQKVAECLVAEGLNVNTVKTQANRWYHHRKQFVI